MGTCNRGGAGKVGGASSQKAKMCTAQESGPCPEAVGRNLRVTEELDTASVGVGPGLETCTSHPAVATAAQRGSRLPNKSVNFRPKCSIL